MKTGLQLLIYSLLLGAIAWLALKPAPKPPEAAAVETRIARGAYLVRLGGCADCHTPKIMTAHGPVDDENRRFAGHPADRELRPAELSSEGPWGTATAGMTAWSGPWGVSYAANLTPDPATGLWSEEVFIRSMRSGRHQGSGQGRPILPPMPWRPLAEATDEDLRAIYAFLHSLPPVHNSVPDPVPPSRETATR